MRFLLLLALVVISITSAQETAAVEAQAQEVPLDQLSDADLEAICTNLGFALVDTDETTGAKLVLSHADYVEAARQCLEVQEQMEEILAENPELLEEYKEERDRMMAAEQTENERLLQEKDRLEAEIADATEATGSGSTAGSTAGGAFGVGKSETTKDKPVVAATTAEPVVTSQPIVAATADATTKTTAAAVDDDADLLNEVLEESSKSKNKLLEEPSTSTTSMAASTSEEPPLLPKALTDVIDKVTTVMDKILALPQVQQVVEKIKPKVQHVVDQVLPKPAQVLIRKVLIRIKDDGLQVLKFAVRQLKVVFGQIRNQLAERKAAKEEEAALGVMNERT